MLGLAAAYYVLFYFSARQVGMNDPDRYYHLAIASLQADHGLLHRLPQVEDLGWGRYFPDKEFLFHVLTWLGQEIAGYRGVLAVVPVLGCGLLALLYLESARVLRPWVAAALVIVAVFVTATFVFRLSLLRPHVLAVGFLLLLVAAILRGRAAWIAVASAGFALSYHAYYLVLLVIGVAVLFRWPGLARRRIVAAALSGLFIGVVVNPYFPSNLVMSWVVVQLALGLNMPPGLVPVPELAPLTAGDYFQAYAVVPLAIAFGVGAAVARWRRAPTLPRADSPPALPFLLLLALALAALAARNPRAMEYAVPVAILTAAHALAAFRGRGSVPVFLGALTVMQFGSARAYYQDTWSQSQAGDSGWYLAAISALPPEASGHKVFNCEWTAGAYLLYWRPDVRFVDLLEPSLLWRASPAKYLAREALIAGREPEPAASLRRDFDADYVMCAANGLVRQMNGDPREFEPLPAPPGPLRLYRLRPAAAVPVPAEATTSARPRTD